MTKTYPLNDDQFRQLKQLGRWLWICVGLIFCMIIIGGITRLTGSGLSIVDWQPIKGTLPPLTTQAWQDLFDAYQQTPEYQQINFGMTLAQFKNIFWLEFIHRFWGRLIGLVFLIPLAIVSWHPYLRRNWFGQLSFIWLLGGLQGVVGWYMVKSGLVNDPHISQYRLTLHLLLGFTTYGLTLWQALQVHTILKYDQRNQSSTSTPSLYLSCSTALYILLWVSFIITFLYGGLVAGLKAGLIYNTFPTMGNEWIPSEWLNMQPIWLNFLENHATVQWCHRVLALTTLTIAAVFYYRTRTQPISLLIFSAFLGQAFLGIITLLLHVPVVMGALHQAGALGVLTVLIYSAQVRRSGLCP